MIEKIIEDKIEFIKKSTGDNVIIEEDNSVGACVDFACWNDMTKLPKILHKNSIDKVHILHELIHLESFFINQYSVIVCNKPDLHKTIDVFKNIPEDFMAHKTIKYKYGLNPIDENWFGRDNDNLEFSDEQIASNLINFYTFCEYCPKYKNELDSFFQNCKQQKSKAYSIAGEVIEVLKNMDYAKKEDYNKCAEKIMGTFTCDHNIFLLIFLKMEIDGSGTAKLSYFIPTRN